MNKYTVLTSFGERCWHSHAKRALQSFVKFWPNEVVLAVVADPECRQYESEMRAILRPQDMLTFNRTPEREAFLKAHKDEGKDYRRHFVRFSHKVWALAVNMASVEGTEYLIWMDSDILTQEPVSMQDIAAWMPGEGQFLSYMGRKDWDDPETGFIAFRVGDESSRFCEAWYDWYITGDLKKENCWTDAHAFELTQARFDPAAMRNLTETVSGRDVFDRSPMAARLYHAKGPVRKQATQQVDEDDPSLIISRQVLDVNNMGIGTVNNLPIQNICSNIFDNLKNIEHWVDYCAKLDEPVVLCSAGPSLNPKDLLPWVEKGVKIVAVKHALDRLRDWGIKPWACLLLDGRGHVGDFIESPDRDVLYITASMVEPSVLQKLNRNRCMVLGYHAYVGHEITQVLPAGSMMVEGGSATTTRGINVLHALGFREFHMYGMDCCYFEKPDLAERKDNGKLRYLEITLSCETWGNKTTKRTFWTEGQFLAQVQEFKRMYLPRKDIKIATYGDGIIPWMQKHMRLFNEWHEAHEERMRLKIEQGKTIGDILCGIDESRNAII